MSLVLSAVRAVGSWVVGKPAEEEEEVEVLEPVYEVSDDSDSDESNYDYDSNDNGTATTVTYSAAEPCLPPKHAAGIPWNSGAAPVATPRGAEPDVVEVVRPAVKVSSSRASIDAHAEYNAQHIRDQAALLEYYNRLARETREHQAALAAAAVADVRPSAPPVVAAPAPAPVPAPAPAPAPVRQAAAVSSATVYIVGKGESYHAYKCGQVTKCVRDNRRLQETTKAAAEARGLVACRSCVSHLLPQQ